MVLNRFDSDWRRRMRVAVGLTAFFAIAVPLRAQDTKTPDTSKARVRLGPVGLNPAIELTNLGVDTNVFNEPEGQEESDFTFTLTPKADVWMKIGPTWITGSIREDLVWYQTFESERATNTFASVNWAVPLNRLAFAVLGSYLHARERPGFEIDERVDRSEVSARALVEYRALSKTFFGVRGGRQHVDFDEDAAFMNTSLRSELNRTATTGAFTVRNQLTPLTSISVDIGRQQDRFEFSPDRDTDSTTADVQVIFDPFALIKGSARFGFRDFEPTDPRVPGYKGTTAAVDLMYVLQGSTRLSVQVNRDVEYSFETSQPYYLQTGVNGSIAQQIYGPLDAVAHAAVQHLAYRDRAGSAVAVPDRTDRVHIYGGGFGYHMGRDLRLGFNIDKQKRLSDDFLRTYDGLRFGVSVTYGL